MILLEEISFPAICLCTILIIMQCPSCAPLLVQDELQRVDTRGQGRYRVRMLVYKAVEVQSGRQMPGQAVHHHSRQLVAGSIISAGDIPLPIYMYQLRQVSIIINNLVNGFIIVGHQTAIVALS